MPWFEKKTPEGKIAYCEKHPTSKRCVIFFREQSMVEKTQPSPAQETSALKKNFDREIPMDSKKESYYETDSEYSWAKKSEIGNLGESIEGLARHNRNKDRDWGDFQNDNFTLKTMLKLSSPDTEDVPKGYEPAFWVIREIMKTYPKNNSINKEKWRDLFKEFYSKGIDIAIEEKNPSLVAIKFTNYLGDQYARLALIGPDVTEERVFCDNARNFALFDKNGPLQKLLEFFHPEGKRKRGDQIPEAFLQLEERLNDHDDLSEKFRKILNGESFSSIIAGEKKKSNTFNEGSIREFLPVFRNGEKSFHNYEDSANFLIKDCLFRSIQFGNTVPKEEREEFLINLSESAKDMTETLGISPRQLSFGGRLIMTLGAINTGNNLASYSPKKELINFKRKKGWGTFAHEWGHALSYMVAYDVLNNKNRLGVKSGKHSSFEISPSYFNNAGLDSHISNFHKLAKKIRERMRQDEDWKNTDVGFAKWLVEGEEIFARLFEAHIYKEVKSIKGVDNKYLANIPSHFGWPTDEELDEFKPIINSLIDYFKNNF